MIDSQTVISIIVAVSILTVALVLLYRLYRLYRRLRRPRWLGETETITIIRDNGGVGRARLSKQKELAAAVKSKKDRFLNLPNISFHYADKERIQNFYNDYFREPTIENMVREVVSEISGDVKGNLPQILEAKLGGRDLTKWISTIKITDISLNGMFLRYQRETILKGQVILDLELVDVELSQLDDFDKLIEKLHKDYELDIPHDEAEEIRSVLKEKAAETTLVKLENASGWVLVEGRFLITDVEEYYNCIYQHPVTEYIAQSVNIVVPLRKAALEPHVAGNYIGSIGKNVPLRVYGEVWQPVNRALDTWGLQITPLAVY